MSKETWAYTQDNPDNPNKGEVRSNSGELICVRAVMNPDDERVMRWIAAAPDMLASLVTASDALEQMARDHALHPYAKHCLDIVTNAREAIAKARGEKP